MKFFIKPFFFFLGTFSFLNGKSQGTKSFCAFDNLNGKYELNLNEDSKSLTYKTYNSIGNLLQTQNGTYVLRDEGVYGPALKVVAMINGYTIKLLVIRDGNGQTQQLQEEREEGVGRVFRICSSSTSQNNIEFNNNSSVSSGSEKIIPANIIGKTIKIGLLEIAQNDFPKELFWEEAKKACISLGNDWRLPTKEEINTLYDNKNKILGFKDQSNSNYVYWSSSLYAESIKMAGIELNTGNYIISMNFSNGRNFAKENESFGLVRAVRSFKPATASEIEQAKLDEQKRLQDEKRRLEEEKKKIEEEKKKSEDAKLATQIKINEIANSTIAIGNLIVSKIDFPELMFWYEAKEACSKLGEGWRLPTIDELRILYENKNIIGSFSEKGYWSSSKGSYDGVVNYIYFENGHLGEDYNKFGMNYVRAVKNKTISIKQEREKRSAQNSNEATIQSITNNNDLLVWWNNNITTIKIGNLEVASKDFPQRMIWDDAQKACQKLGNGWRMPNSAELILLHKNKSKIGGFADGSYWSSTDTEAGKPIAFDGIQGARGLTFGDGKHAYYSKADDCNVRAVRNN